jgi:hypothetical protein
VFLFILQSIPYDYCKKTHAVLLVFSTCRLHSPYLTFRTLAQF